MANSTYCVSCAQLPLKGRSLAVKTQQCLECRTTFGVTSYGAPFRVKPDARILHMSPALFATAVIGAGLFVFVVMLIGLGIWSHEQIVPKPRVQNGPVPHEFARVPEVALNDAFDPKVQPTVAKLRIQELIKKIKKENDQQQDKFLLTLMDTRKEVRGLPFAMGGACRIGQGPATLFQAAVEAARHGMDQDAFPRSSMQQHQDESTPFWAVYNAETQNQDTDAGVAALTQILGPERGTLRASMVQHLAASSRPTAIRTIAKAAIFDASSDARLAAIKALKDRPEAKEQYTDILMHGLRYPMAIVAKRSAQAIIALDRKDLMPQVAAFLGETAPGDPQVVDGKECVREVVRINHHRNCLLCHPPASQQALPNEVPGVMPIPGTPFPSSPSEAYGNAQSFGDPMVRADTTYLRQDFSARMPVANASPWPEMQRFDFLVRTRVVEGKELAALQQQVQARAADFLSENHKAAIRVLSELTGQANVAPTQKAWQAVLAAK